MMTMIISRHTYNGKRSDDRNERNIRQRALEMISIQMFLKSITIHTSEARYKNARYQHVADRHHNRQRRYHQRCHHRHHKVHRPKNPPQFLQHQPSFWRHRNKQYTYKIKQDYKPQTKIKNQFSRLCWTWNPSKYEC